MKTLQKGFTLLELVVFIVITSILASTLLLTFKIALLNTPGSHYISIANLLADQCMEGFVGKRRLLGYTNVGLVCSASPPLPAVCIPPTGLTGFTVAASILCNVTLVGDTASSSRTVTVTVTGLAQTSLTTLIASY